MNISQQKQEEERIEALNRYNIMDTTNDNAFDQITRLAAYICRTPMAAISFIDSHREWFKSEVGLSVKEVPLDESFGVHLISQPDKPLIISDALDDDRVSSIPLVTSNPKVRFYTGIPLVAPKGYVIGTLSVLGHLPKELSFDQVELLRFLGNQIVAQLELRRSTKALTKTISEREEFRNDLKQYHDEIESLKTRIGELSKHKEDLENEIKERDRLEKDLQQSKKKLEEQVMLQIEEISQMGEKLELKGEQQKGFEEKLSKYRQDLEQRVRKRTEELKSINNQLLQEVSERKESEQNLQKINAELTDCINELEQRNHKIRLLNEMGELLQAGHTADETYSIIVNYAQKLFPANSGVLYVINNDMGNLQSVAEWGDVSSKQIFLPNECWALRLGRVHAIENTESEPICKHVTPERPNCYICVPMVAQGKAIGIFYYQSSHKHNSRLEREQFKKSSKKQIVVAMAERVALTLGNLELRETLEMYSIIDPLTELYNRRYMLETFERELSRIKRNNLPLSVMMIDIDHFKTINDNFGHAAGDALLRKLGLLLKSNTRKEDIVCRYGGEEFLIILPGSTVDHTEHRAEELKKEIKQLNVWYRGRSIGPVTVSIGVAAYNQHNEDIDSILESADSALYRAKEEGRDTIIVSK